MLLHDTMNAATQPTPPAQPRKTPSEGVSTPVATTSGAATPVATPVATTSGRDIIITRVIDATPGELWPLFTNPDHLLKWWGPRGFTTITSHYDLRPGGTWRYIMRGPDGREYPNFTRFLEVEEPRRLAFKHGETPVEEPMTHETVITFEPIGARQTRVTLAARFQSPEIRELVANKYGAVEGGVQTMTRLGEYLEETRSTGGAGAEGGAGGGGGSRPGEAAAAADAARTARFSITRVIHAPRELVFRAWTNADHLSKWFGPKGLPIAASKMDLRVGGMFLYSLRSPTGQEMWGRWVFKEIVPGERLTFVFSFSDPTGGVTRAPMSSTWPLEMLTTVSFADHAGIGRGTVMTLTSEPINASAEEAATMRDAMKSLNEGWGGTFDQLEAYLAPESRAGA